MKDKVAMVTGASRGIGRATAIALASLGVKVVLDYYSDQEANANEVLDIIRSAGGEADIFHADVRSEDEVKSLIEFTIKKYGKIDYLINNAGIVYDKVWYDKEIVEWDDTFRTNLYSHFLLIKYAKDYLIESRGKVVNVSSTNATDRYSTFSMDYDASKAGVVNLTKNMCKALAPYVNVNAVLPGWVNTSMNDGLEEEFIKSEMDKIALGRFAEPEEIADLIVHLCSDQARYINGACIVIDGGRRD